MVKTFSNKAPPRSYFERFPEIASRDNMTRGLSGGEVGMYRGRYVNLETRKYITSTEARKIIDEVTTRLTNNPVFNFGSSHR